MTAGIGTVKSAAVAKARNSTGGNVRLLQVELGESLQTVQLVPQAGEEHNPPAGSLAVCVRVGGRWFALATFDGIEPDAAEGERRLYSSSGGSVMAQIRLKADGTIVVTTAAARAVEINGSSKQFVTHAELNSALQSFVTALNLHTHPTAASGPPSPPTAPMSINISAAATTTVKTGG